MKVTIFGKGHLGQALAKKFEKNGNEVEFITHEDGKSLSELVILAVPYAAMDDIVKRYADELKSKVVVDATNPINFKTWKLIPKTSSAEELQNKLLDSYVVKAFNTVTAASYNAGKLKDGSKPQVLMAGSSKAKEMLRSSLVDDSLELTDLGELKNAGLVELALAAQKQMPMNGGIKIIK